MSSTSRGMSSPVSVIVSMPNWPGQRLQHVRLRDRPVPRQDLHDPLVLLVRSVPRGHRLFPRDQPHILEDFQDIIVVRSQGAAPSPKTTPAGTACGFDIRPACCVRKYPFNPIQSKPESPWPAPVPRTPYSSARPSCGRILSAVRRKAAPSSPAMTLPAASPPIPSTNSSASTGSGKPSVNGVAANPSRTQSVPRRRSVYRGADFGT